MDVTDETTRHFLFRGFQGCTNHGCVVTGPKEGMGTNGICSCVEMASRQQLNILSQRLGVLLTGCETRGEREGEGCT
jgi:hypothetical protein